jgi:hypothetical protein
MPLLWTWADVVLRCPHVTGGPFLENKDQFMLGAVETPHSGVGLVAHAGVLQFSKYDLAGCSKLTRVPPVHADKSDWPISASLGRRRGSVPERS